MKKILSILVIMSLSLFAEPSVYGFDDSVDNEVDTIDRGDRDDISYKKDRGDIIINEYKREREIPIVTTQKVSIDSLKQQIDEQAQRIDGLTSIIEGLSSSLNEIQQSKNQNIDVVNTSTYTPPPTNDYKEIDTPIVEPVEPIIDKPVVDTPMPLSSKSNSLLFSEGVTSFLNQRYDDAHNRFILTDSKGYKVAASNYYLGEIAYYTKDYKNAIFYFKKSAGIDDKTTYIDTLLLHTGVSFENSGNKEKAKAFYQNILDVYPNKKTAKIAKEKLRKL